jgi:hypothetical protein
MHRDSLTFSFTDFLSLLFSSLKEEKYGYEIRALCLYGTPFQQLRQLTDFHEILYKRYAIRGYSNLVYFHFLQSLITWRTTNFWDGSDTNAT